MDVFLKIGSQYTLKGAPLLAAMLRLTLSVDAKRRFLAPLFLLASYKFDRFFALAKKTWQHKVSWSTLCFYSMKIQLSQLCCVALAYILTIDGGFNWWKKKYAYLKHHLYIFNFLGFLKYFKTFSPSVMMNMGVLSILVHLGNLFMSKCYSYLFIGCNPQLVLSLTLEVGLDKSKPL